MTRLLLVGLVLAGMVCAGGALADQTIDQLGPAAPASDSDLIAVESGGVAPAKQMSLGTLRAYITTVATPAFYVASTGSDTNAGTLAAPFKTVQACQAAMHASSTIKICYIRSGVYTGSGVGYTAQTIASGTGYSISASIHLTSADNGETLSYYPSDGYNTAIFDGGAGTWAQVTGAASGCTPNTSPTTAMGRGIEGDGVSNFTINGLTFRNYCYGGIGISGDTPEPSACFTGTAPGTASSSNLIENNIIFNISDANQQCANDFVFGGRALHVAGNVQNTTITHNLVYNTTGGGIALSQASLIGNFSNGLIDHNLIVNTNSGYSDNGALYLQDIGVNCNLPPNGQYCHNFGPSTNVKVQYNYVMDWGGGGDGNCTNAPGGTSAGSCNNAYYNDDGTSSSMRIGNIALGKGGTGASTAFFQHGGTNNSTSGNIVDLSDRSVLPSLASSSGTAWYWVNSPNGPSGTDSHFHDIVIANTSVCAVVAGPAPICALQENDGGATITVGNNNYWNYNAAGNSPLTGSATSNGDSSPNTVDAFGNTTTRCPGGNLDSWGYVIPAGNAVFSAPVTFPAQPTGWATTGFWGPPAGPNWNGKIPHTLAPSYTATIPSYGPTC